MASRSIPRNAYWDNLKAVLIFLVVLGHYLLPVCNRGRSVNDVFFWIYLFHMPTFIFVSGFFAKNYIKKGAGIEKPAGFLVLYIGFMLLLWLVGALLNGHFSALHIFTTSGAPWYMMSMFLWYLALPLLSKIRPLPALVFALLLGLFIGTDGSADAFLSLSRTIVFLPFFLAGFHFDPERVRRIPSWTRVLASLILLTVLLILFFSDGALKPYLSIVYADSSYSELSFGTLRGMLVRLLWYATAAAMTASLLCLIPGRHLFFTYVGSRTLAIYVIHRVLRDVLQHFGLYDHLGTGITCLCLSAVLSLIIVFLASGKRTSALFSKAFSLPWEKLLRDTAHTSR